MDKKANKKQLSLIKQFWEFTGSANKNLAFDILKDWNWRVEQACEVYFTTYAGNEPPMQADPAPKIKKKSGDNSAIKGK